MTDNTEAAKAYIQQRLREWLDLFPGLRMRYYFEQCSDVHFVALDPTSYPMDDDSFLDAQSVLMDDVRNTFTEHGVAPFFKPEFEHHMREGTIEITRQLSEAS
jgi:hypothetical protein